MKNPKITKSSRYDYLKSLFIKSYQIKNGEKLKKQIHLSAKEQLHVAQLIDGGASHKEVSDWHLMRFGKEMSRSKFFRYKSNASKIIKDSDDKITKKYTRNGESDLIEFENHLKSEIAARSNGQIRWTYLLLSTLALQEREKEPYSNMEVLKKYIFTDRY